VCCRHESGTVWLTGEDLERLARHFNIGAARFVKTYCRRWSGKLPVSLREKANLDCVFWNDGCGVYTARPAQCRDWPFWEELLSSQEQWDRAAAGCPGMGTGKLHSKAEIDAILTRREAAVYVKTGDAILDDGDCGRPL
jgi:Fe-S-cluster containining protein